MLMPCGPSAVPTGGAGVACPAGSASFTTTCTSLVGAAIESLPGLFLDDARRSDRLDLPVLELDRRLPGEDHHVHAHEPLLRVHLGDDAAEVLEGAFLDLDLVAHAELHLQLRLVLGRLHAADEL